MQRSSRYVSTCDEHRRSMGLCSVINAIAESHLQYLPLTGVDGVTESSSVQEGRGGITKLKWSILVARSDGSSSCHGRRAGSHAR
eukprot:34926-Eustigmatos_ZCMA.PRE.1